MVQHLLSVIGVLALQSFGVLALEQRSHNHGPEWIDHCWDQAANHVQDPFCAFLTDVACTGVPEVDHATHTVPDNTKLGAVVTYTCDDLYSREGNDTIVCTAVDGENGSKVGMWTATPSCQITSCPPAPTISNGQTLPYNETNIGEVVQYVCEDNYVFNTSYNYVMCQNDTTWSTAPYCVPVCPPPPTVANGQYTLKAGKMLPGTEIVYFCNEQYGIRETASTTCTKEGYWSVPYPKCDCIIGPLDILFVLDASGSVGMRGFQETLSFVNNIVDVYGTGQIKFGLLSFSDVIDPGFNFNTYDNDTQALKEAIANISYATGSTDTAQALQYAREQSFSVLNGMRDSATQIAIVITDGQSDDTNETQTESALLRAHNVTIYAVGVGAANAKELKDIASSDSYVFYVENYNNISQVSGPLASSICQGGCPAVPDVAHGTPLNPLDTDIGSVVNYVCDDGYMFQSTDHTTCNESNSWTQRPVCIQIPKCDEPPTIQHGSHGNPTTYEVGGTVQYTCDSSRAYVLVGNETSVCEDSNGIRKWTPIPKCECERNIDVVFVVDGSGSVGLFGFTDTLNFVNDMISRYSAATTRFGLLVFSSANHLAFQLDEYIDDVDAMKEKVANTSYPTGNTYTYDALSYARIEMFQKRNGMRSNASQIAIIVTDGKSQDSNRTVDEAEKLRAAGVIIYSIGVGPSVDDDELSGMASTGGFVFHVEDYTNITTVAGPLAETTCIVDCGPPSPIDNGSPQNVNDTQVGQVVEYTCNEGYSFESQSTVMCQASASWTQEPTCVMIQCGAPPTIEHGYALNENDTRFGAQVNYTCDADYIFDSNYDVTCEESGNWTVAPICRRAQCGAVPVVLHGLNSTPNNTFVGTRINYSCENNYRLVGKETVTCHIDEQWTTTPTCECQSSPLDVVFIADTSGSVGTAGFDSTLNFLVSLTSAYPPDGTRFGMVTFSSSARVEFYLDTYINDKVGLISAIKNASFVLGGTDTYEALQIAGSELFNVTTGMRPNVTQIAVVVTDGQSNNATLTLSDARKLKESGVTIYSVGVGDFDTAELKAMASNETYVFSAQTFGDLSSVAGPLSDLICFGKWCMMFLSITILTLTFTNIWCLAGKDENTTGSTLNDVSTSVTGSTLNDVSTSVTGSPLSDVSTSVTGSPLNDVSTSVTRSTLNDVSTSVTGSPLSDVSTSVTGSPLSDVSTSVTGSPLNDVSTSVTGSPLNDVSTSVTGSTLNDVSTSVNGSTLNDVSTSVNGSTLNDVSTSANGSTLNDVSTSVNGSTLNDVSTSVTGSTLSDVSTSVTGSPLNDVSTSVTGSTLNDVSTSVTGSTLNDVSTSVTGSPLNDVSTSVTGSTLSDVSTSVNGSTLNDVSTSVTGSTLSGTATMFTEGHSQLNDSGDPLAWSPADVNDTGNHTSLDEYYYDYYYDDYSDLETMLLDLSVWVTSGPGVVFNILIIIVVCKIKPFGTNSLFMFVLGITDLICVLSRIGLVSLQSYSKQSYGMCKLTKYVTAVTSIYSNLIVVLWTVERFIAVWFPIKYTLYCTFWNTLIALIGTGIIFSILSIPNVIHAFPNTFEGGGFTCQHSEFMHDIWLPLESVYHIWVPLVVICTLNIMIIQRIFSKNKERLSKAISSERAQQRSREQMQMTRVLVAVSVVFLLLHMPLAGSTIYLAISGRAQELIDDPFALLSIVWCWVVSEFQNSVNFLLYCLTGREFRSRICKLMCTCTRNSDPPSQEHPGTQSTSK